MVAYQDARIDGLRSALAILAIVALFFVMGRAKTSAAIWRRRTAF